MSKINFLPHEIKDIMFKQKKIFINYSIGFVFLTNTFLLSHIFYGIYEFNLKENIASKIEVQVFNNSYKENDGLDFFQENIVNHFSYEGVNIKGLKLSLKISIKDKDEFSKSVKDLEKIKKCDIDYLIAPYEENGLVKFEVGLEVKE